MASEYLYLKNGKAIKLHNLYPEDATSPTTSLWHSRNKSVSMLFSQSESSWDDIGLDNSVYWHINGGSIIRMTAIYINNNKRFQMDIIYSNGREEIAVNYFECFKRTDNLQYGHRAIGITVNEEINTFRFESFFDSKSQWANSVGCKNDTVTLVDFAIIDPDSAYGINGNIRVYPNYLTYTFINPKTDDVFNYSLLVGEGGEDKPAPYPEGNTTGGGYGTQDFSTDETGRPSLPSINNSNTGFTKLFMPNQSELNNLHKYLWKADVATALRRVFDNADDAIISLQLMPCSVPTTPHTLNYSFLDVVSTGVSLSQALDSYYETSFTIKLEECFASCMDYEASSYQLYLPYYGIAKIEAEDLYNTDTHEGYNIEVLYQVDLTNGDTLITFFNIDQNYIVYQWCCNVASDIIINSGRGSGSMWFDFWSNVGMSAATMGVMGGASGGAVTIGAEQGNMASQLVSSVMANKGNISHSGSIGGSMKHGGLRVPYLYITYPHLALAKDYGKLNGYACNYYSKIGDNSGYTVCQLVHLDTITCFNSEREELESLLTSGVIINQKEITEPTAELVLYHNKSENIEVYKDLEELGSFENIEVMDETNLSSPSFHINSITAEAVKGTYLYYKPFKRYYYVDSITMVNNDLWRLETTCDLLMSFRDELMEQTAILNRQANNYNLYLSDTYFKAEADAIVCGRKFDGSFDSLNYFLLVASDDFN